MIGFVGSPFLAKEKVFPEVRFCELLPFRKEWYMGGNIFKGVTRHPCRGGFYIRPKKNLLETSFFAHFLHTQTPCTQPVGEGLAPPVKNLLEMFF
jgi:hypothetical protein